MRLKPVFTWDATRLRVRLFRLIWQCGVVGDGSGGYSAMVSFGISPNLLSFEREYSGWILCVLGLRVHYKKVYGGIFA